jgi:DNA-binding NtrC family response regulator
LPALEDVLPPLPHRGDGPVVRPQGLRVHRPGLAPSLVTLREEEALVLGRHDAADVVFESGAVSRLHGLLRFEDGRWRYRDNASRNGSVLVRAGAPRGVPVTPHQPVDLGLGDVVELGTGEARVELVASAATPAAEGLLDATLLSAAARSFAQRMAVAARTKVPVFLLGPSGCGKTHAAREIHRLSLSRGALVPVNCARLPQDVSALHSELLGHVRGAFTGAEAPRTGKLVHAHGGTLFLDEVECLSPLAQGFLLDVLEGSGDVGPLGSREPVGRPVLFRLVSASKVPLGQGHLRPDLCERLAEGHMWRLPTLEERREDIPGLVRLFAEQQSSMLGTRVEVTDEALAHAATVAWPGQVRQLRAMVVVLSQAALATGADQDAPPNRVLIRLDDVVRHLRERDDAFGPSAPVATMTLSDADGLKLKADARSLTRQQVVRALDGATGNQSEAARQLGIARNTLRRRMADFGIG